MNTYYHFENALLFTVKGKDAERYVNARITQGLDAVSTTQASPCAILNAQGRTLGFFHFLRYENGFLFIADGGEPDEVLTAFKQFIVADQVEVENISNKAHLVHIASDENPPELFSCNMLKKPFNVHATDSYLTINNPRIAAYGADIILFSETEIPLEKTTHSEFSFLQILNGNLRFPEELKDLFFPESEIDKAVSDRKGCYCGQEAVEMVRSRGKLPAMLGSLCLDGRYEIEPKTKVYADPEHTRAVGTVLSSAFSESANKTACSIRVKPETFETLFLECTGELGLTNAT